MTTTQMVVTLALVMAGTVVTRFLPFAVFPAGRETPAFIRYLGRVLPAAALGLLVVYCYKGLDLTGPTHGLPELIAGAVVVVLQGWRRNMFLSIVAGTALYLVLLRAVF